MRYVIIGAERRKVKVDTAPRRVLSYLGKGGAHMRNTTPYEKLAKREKRALNEARRKTWGEISPVTRRPENPRAYNRKKAQRWKDVPFVALFA